MRILLQTSLFALIAAQAIAQTDTATGAATDAAEGAAEVATDAATATADAAGDAVEAAGDAATAVADAASDAADAAGDAVDSALAALEVPADAVPEGFTMMDLKDVSPEGLANAGLYNLDGQKLGNLAGFVDEADKTKGVVAEIGGFLGLGKKSVALEAGKIAAALNPATTDLRILTAGDKDSLKALPDYGM